MKALMGVICLVALAAVFTGLSVVSAGAQEIGLAWEGKSGMAGRVVQGFEQGIKEFASDMKIEYRKELSSIDELGEVASKWQTEKNGMVILRSSGAKWLGQNPPSIPSFIGGCTHPGQLGAIKNLQSPEGNITGVTYYLPIDSQFEIFQAIIPDLKSVLLLLEEGHVGSVIDQEGTKAACSKFSIDYKEKFCISTEDAISAVQEYKGKVSGIIIGNQSLNIDNAEKIVAAAGKTPVLSFSSKPVKVGALGGFVADDVKLGYMLAKSVADILLKGKSIKDIPVKVDPDPNFFVNVTTAEKLGLDIPFTILETATVIE